MKKRTKGHQYRECIHVLHAIRHQTPGGFNSLAVEFYGLDRDL